MNLPHMDNSNPQPAQPPLSDNRRGAWAPQTPTKIGIVGCSGYAYELINRIWQLKSSMELVAAYTPVASAPEVAVCKAHGVRVFDDFDSFIDYIRDHAAAVLNPTPIHRHQEISLRCLRAGVSVWLEKPPVATTAEWDELQEASLTYGKRIEVCFNSLYLPSVSLLKSRILAGDFGQVLRICGIGAWQRNEQYYQRSDWSGKVRLGGKWVLDGTINNPLAHLLCNCLYFAGTERSRLAQIREVHARLWHANPIQSEDTSSLRIITQTGVEILTNMTLCADSIIPPRMTLHTEHAEIIFEDFQDISVRWHNGWHEHFPDSRENRLYMLETLNRSLYEDIATPCPLEATRPFTEVVNAAFYQVLKANNGSIPQVQKECLLVHTDDNESTTTIAGISRLMLQADRAGTLLDLPVTVPAEPGLTNETVEELSVVCPAASSP